MEKIYFIKKEIKARNILEAIKREKEGTIYEVQETDIEVGPTKEVKGFNNETKRNTN